MIKESELPHQPRERGYWEDFLRMGEDMWAEFGGEHGDEVDSQSIRNMVDFELLVRRHEAEIHYLYFTSRKPSRVFARAALKEWKEIDERVKQARDFETIAGAIEAGALFAQKKVEFQSSDELSEEEKTRRIKACETAIHLITDPLFIKDSNMLT